MLEQAGADGDVGGGLALALVGGAHRVPELQPDVPERRQQRLDERGFGGCRRLRQQDQHVDVGMGEELAAAVAADGDQRRTGGGAELGPHRAQQAVDQARVPAEEAGGVRRGEKGVPQDRTAALELGAVRGEARARAGAGWGGGGVDDGRHGRGRGQVAGGGGVPADTVRTS